MEMFEFDPASPLVQLLNVAYSQAELLQNALDDDAEAIRTILAGPESIAAAENGYQEQVRYAPQTGRKPRKCFDERDEKRAKWNGGGHGFERSPAPSRVEELLNEWGQRDHYTKFARVYQAALDECRDDHLGAVVGERADAVYEAHMAQLNCARELTGKWPPVSNRDMSWGLLREKHHRAVTDLMPLCRRKKPAAGTAPQPDAAPIPVCLGQGRYSVGENTICLEGTQAAVLDFLVEVRAANQKDIIDSTGCSNPSATLKGIRQSHAALTPFISLAGGKAKGGYSTTIIDGRVRQG